MGYRVYGVWCLVYGVGRHLTVVRSARLPLIDGLAVLGLHASKGGEETRARLGDGVLFLHASDDLVSKALIRPVLAGNLVAAEFPVAIGVNLDVNHGAELGLLHQVLHNLDGKVLAARAHAFHVKSNLDLVLGRKLGTLLGNLHRSLLPLPHIGLDRSLQVPDLVSNNCADVALVDGELPRVALLALLLVLLFRVQGSGFRVHGSGFRVQGSWFRVHGSGFMVQGSGFRVQISRRTPSC